MEKPENKPNDYLRYSGIGFQLAATIGLGAFIGYELDKWQHTSNPYYTVGFSIIFLVIAFYLAFRDLMKK